MTSYAQGRAEMKEKERQLETQCEQLRQTDEKLAAVLQNDSQIAGYLQIISAIELKNRTK